MSSDSGERLPEPPRPDFTMPNMLDIEMRAVEFERPRHRNFTSSLESGGAGVELIVRTDRPIPIRALGPVLYIGGTPVTEVTEVGPNTYRFVAPARETLEADAPIRLGWTGQPPREMADTEAEAAFRFRL